MSKSRLILCSTPNRYLYESPSTFLRISCTVLRKAVAPGVPAFFTTKGSPFSHACKSCGSMGKDPRKGTPNRFAIPWGPSPDAANICDV
jgi:hypothetical protein